MTATKNTAVLCRHVRRVDVDGCILPNVYSSGGAWKLDKRWERPWKGRKLMHKRYPPVWNYMTAGVTPWSVLQATVNRRMFLVNKSYSPTCVCYGTHISLKVCCGRKSTRELKTKKKKNSTFYNRFSYTVRISKTVLYQIELLVFFATLLLPVAESTLSGYKISSPSLREELIFARSKS